MEGTPSFTVIAESARLNVEAVRVSTFDPADLILKPLKLTAPARALAVTIPSRTPVPEFRFKTT
jgi:hypothetical protein